MRKIELLAPAGSLNILKAVVSAGADAVYVGGAMFSARAYATNFNKEEMLEAIEYCHIHGAKIHMTVNTCLKNLEIKELVEYLSCYYEAGLDAVIVQDMGVFSIIRHYFPDMEIHASTQTTLTSPMGVQLMKQMGANRVVLARELSIEEIKSIHESIPDIELETFIHGALCFSYSGQCLFSGYLGGRSGNRGRCAGPCRLCYSVEKDNVIEIKDKYPLSLKDFCGVRYLKQLFEAGVSSLKIEGRMKSVEYAYGVTALYRKALDNMYKDKDFDLYSELMEMGNRSGFTDKYLVCHNDKTMVSIDSPSHTAPKNSNIDIQLIKRPVVIKACIKTGDRPELELICGEHVITYCGEQVIDAAKNAPTTYDDVKKTLLGLGDTEFVCDEISITLDENCFVPKGYLKNIRRGAFALLKDKILADSIRCTYDISSIKTTLETRALEKVYVSVDNDIQLTICLKYPWIDTILIPIEIAENDALSSIHKKGKKIGISLPLIIRQDKLSIDKLIEKIKQYDTSVEYFYANTFDCLGLLRTAGIEENKIIAGANIYTYNDYATAWVGKFAQINIIPLELSIGEISHRNNSNSILTVYGHAPFMVTAQCINNNCFGCNHKEANISLIDRKNMKLRVKNNCNYCYNVIYNPKPTIIFDDMQRIFKAKISSFILNFSIESEAETENILQLFQNAVLENGNSSVNIDYTRGHYKKGVE